MPSEQRGRTSPRIRESFKPLLKRRISIRTLAETEPAEALPNSIPPRVQRNGCQKRRAVQERMASLALREGFAPPTLIDMVRNIGDEPLTGPNSRCALPCVSNRDFQLRSGGRIRRLPTPPIAVSSNPRRQTACPMPLYAGVCQAFLRNPLFFRPLAQCFEPEGEWPKATSTPEGRRGFELLGRFAASPGVP